MVFCKISEGMHDFDPCLRAEIMHTLDFVAANF